MTAVENLSVWVGALMSLIGLSFIWFGRTKFFRFGQSLYLGAGVAYTFFTVWRTLVSSAFTPIAAGRYTLIAALFIGGLCFTRVTKYRWLARYPIALLAGIGVGIIFGLTLRSQILNQISASLTNLTTLTPDPISAVLMLVGTITSLLYFTYSRDHTGRYGWVVRIGRLFLMPSFGYVLATDNIGHANGLVTLIQNLLRDPLATLGITW